MYKVILKTERLKKEQEIYKGRNLFAAKDIATLHAYKYAAKDELEYCKVIDENGKTVWEY